jgi:secreted trypsin-like serine protease
VCAGALVGIVSHGLDCGLPNYPGIYMDVAYYSEFIMTGTSSATSLLTALKVTLISFIMIIFVDF